MNYDTALRIARAFDTHCRTLTTKFVTVGVRCEQNDSYNLVVYSNDTTLKDKLPHEWCDIKVTFKLTSQPIPA